MMVSARKGDTVKKLTKKNLKLSRETLHALEVGELDQVHGGSRLMTNCATCDLGTGGHFTCLC
jgi:hypothetical protein